MPLIPHTRRFYGLTLLGPALVAMVATAACTPRQATPASTIEDVDAATFVARSPIEGVILDVRSPEEVAEGRLAGALNANVLADDFEATVDALDRETPVYLYCRSGNRSGRAAEVMRSMGFRTLYNIGGYEALKAAGAEVVE